MVRLLEGVNGCTFTILCCLQKSATSLALLVDTLPIMMLFYQLEGEVTVYIQEEGKKKAMKLSAGDMYLHPAKVPHSPARTEGSVGLVIERKRAGKGFNDGLLWFCDNCNHKLHEVYFELHDIEKDFLPHFSTFYNSEEKRTCKKCGTVMETNPKFTTKK